MSKVEKIRKEIERLKKSLPWGSCASQISMECNCKNEAYNEVLSYIVSLEEEPVSNDLEKELDKYFSQFKGLEKCYWNWRIDSINIHAQGIYDFAKHFFELGLKAKGE